MNLLQLASLTRSRINRVVLPEAKRIAMQALLGLKKIVGESLFKLFLRLLFNYVMHEVAIYLYDYFLS